MIFSNKVDKYVKSHKQGLSKTSFVAIYLDSHDEAFSSSTICVAFCKCGINPFNPDVSSEADFAPSQATSTVASPHLPSSFPVKSEEWEQESAGVDKESEDNNKAHFDAQEHTNDSAMGPLTLPPLYNHHTIATISTDPPAPISIPKHILSLLKDELIRITQELQNQNQKLQDAVEKANMHAVIAGQQYSQLQKQVNTKNNTPKTSCQSFSTTACVLNTSDALAIIATKRATELARAQQKELEREEKSQKAEEAHVVKAKKAVLIWATAAVKIVKECEDLKMKRLAQEEKEQMAQVAKETKAHLTQEAKATKAAKAAAKQLEKEEKQQRKGGGDCTAESREGGREDCVSWKEEEGHRRG
ncbi:hypothetical protein BS47DRAFT_1402117 [Hydnum rufescens UP504]|uniref:Uncharacterized protein n=1 Tax=Hydnum rufescens UP504 TaxID=1448309 RepID=A0A9P6AEJ6_9AGAM|nr:hypothetical protein BS47DRAFT_1402117 [Hydnum rufescens UP504]